MESTNINDFIEWKNAGIISQSAFEWLRGDVKRAERGKGDNKNEKKISVSISTHNRKDRLKCLIECILRQEYLNYEIIVVDDASTDGTNLMIEELKKCNPQLDLKYWVNKPNRGVTYSKRKGFELSSGDILIFSDDDDYLIDANYFKRINKLYDNSDCIMTVASTLTHDERDNRYYLDLVNFTDPISNSEYMQGFMTNYIKPNSMFTLSLNAKKMKEIHYEQLKCFNDCSLYLYALLAEGKVYPINDAMGVYSKQVFSMTSGISSKYVIENVSSKVDIGNAAAKMGYLISKNKWIYKQCEITLSVFFMGKIKSAKEFFEVMLWIIRNIPFPYSLIGVSKGVKSRIFLLIHNR